MEKKVAGSGGGLLVVGIATYGLIRYARSRRAAQADAAAEQIADQPVAATDGEPTPPDSLRFTEEPIARPHQDPQEEQN